MTFSEIWPLARLRITSPALELRYPSEEDLLGLCDVAAAGIHPPEFMPFDNAWTDVTPDVLRPELLRYHRRLRADWTPDAWTYPFAVLVDGELVGTQDLSAKAFAVRREVVTGSWLGQRYQSRGIGTEMRAAVLHLAFAALGAVSARSAARVDNASSLGVSRKLGYVDDGIDRVAVRGQSVLQQRLRLERDAWESRRRDDITVSGLEGCRDWFGC
jgi:RimJ/RimL family protein N-acetyltransferase